MMMMQNKIYAQSDIVGLAGVGHAAASNTGYYVGWDANTTFPLNIEHRSTYDIDFLLGGTQYMTIKGTSYANPGFVGINLASPSNRLDVLDASNNGQLRLSYSSTVYTEFFTTSGGNMIIRPKSGSSNKFVGIGGFTAGAPPATKLDVLAPSNPQLRLTNVQSGGGAGRWAEFTVTSSGDLNIDPTSNDGATAQNVGIHTTSPSATLHVMGNS